MSALDEAIADGFAGGGGASTGIEMALGRSPDVAINHDAAALAMHRANHRDTEHLTSDIWEVDPYSVVPGRPIGLAWFSPDCKHFSKAKGAALVDRNIRSLAWVVVDWAEKRKPRVIILENVEEFTTWGPVGNDNKPIKELAGIEFEAWLKRLRKAGYKVEYRELRACDYGAPTIRKRLFVIARRDGQPIVWPKPTHAAPDDQRVVAGALLPWRTAAGIIDWSLPCPSIFDTREQIREKYGLRAQRPLAEATMRRIARGVRRYVLDAAKPFIIRTDMASAAARNGLHGLDEPTRTQTTAGSFAVVAPVVTYAQQGGGNRPADAPLHTVTASAKDQNAVIVPTLVQTGYGEREGQAPRVPGIDKPLGTQVAGAAKHAVVAAFLAQHNTGVVGHEAGEPVSTIVQKGCTQGLVAAHLMMMRNSGKPWTATDEPMHTVTAGGAHPHLVAAFLDTYYGTEQAPDLGRPMPTETTKERRSLVTVEIDGETFVITDIGMRMLTPRERFRAQGFPDSYEIETGIDADGNPVTLSGEAQGRMCGNSVCPPLAEALVAANCADMAVRREAAA